MPPSCTTSCGPFIPCLFGPAVGCASMPPFCSSGCAPYLHCGLESFVPPPRPPLPPAPGLPPLSPPAPPLGPVYHASCATWCSASCCGFSHPALECGGCDSRVQCHPGAECYREEPPPPPPPSSP
eukprot:3081281-Prymnesium_polylepis.1